MLALMLGNPWSTVPLRSVSMKAEITEKDTVAVVKSVQLPTTVFAPGEVVTARVTMEPMRATDLQYDISLTIPKNLTEGKYSL